MAAAKVDMIFGSGVYTCSSSMDLMLSVAGGSVSTPMADADGVTAVADANRENRVS